MHSFLDIFYGIIFEPVNTFSNFDNKKDYKLLFLILILLSVFNLLSQNFISSFFSILFYSIFSAFFIDFLARIFMKNSNFFKLLILFITSFIPYIFIPPLFLLKNSYQIFENFAVLLMFALFFWTIILQIIAISKTYNIEYKNSFYLLFIPFLGMILYLLWIFDFGSKIFNFLIF